MRLYVCRCPSLPYERLSGLHESTGAHSQGSDLVCHELSDHSNKNPLDGGSPVQRLLHYGIQ